MSVEYTRLSLKGIQVPRLTFENADGHKIVLQGIGNVGDRSFYQNVLREAKNHKGEVHMVGMSNSTNDPRMLFHQQLNNVAACASNKTKRDDYFNRSLIDSDPDRFKNYDLDVEDIVADLDKTMAGKDYSFLGGNPTEEEVKVIATIMMLGSYNLIPLRSSISRLVEDNYPLLISKRNEYAISKAMSTDKDVMLLWGIVNLPGMVEILNDNNYTLKSTQWDTITSSLRKKNSHASFKKRRDVLTKELMILMDTLNLNEKQAPQ